MKGATYTRARYKRQVREPRNRNNVQDEPLNFFDKGSPFMSESCQKPLTPVA